MKRKIRWIIGLITLLTAVISLGLAAQPAGHGGRGGPGVGHEPPQIDVAGAAATFGVAEDELAEALGLPAGGPQQRPERQDGEHERPDLAAAAETLGITEDVLKDALGEPQQAGPELGAAAAMLGISEEALIDALGVPADGPQGERPQGERLEGERPKLDLEGAAEFLGVSVDELAGALGLPGTAPGGGP